MTDREYQWRYAVADAETAAAEAFAYCVADPDLDPEYGAEDAAHEFADGSEWVIYYHRARCLWVDSTEVQDAEAELDEIYAPYGVDSHLDIDGRIALCVYVALRNVFVEKWGELYEAHEAETADECDAEEVEA